MVTITNPSHVSTEGLKSVMVKLFQSTPSAVLVIADGRRALVQAKVCRSGRCVVGCSHFRAYHRVVDRVIRIELEKASHQR
jgi:hypothetical protein